MKYFRWLSIIVLTSFLLSACGAGNVSIPGFPTETPLPQPIVNVTPAPDANATMAAYLDAFKK